MSEDALVIGALALAFSHPWLALGLAVSLSIGLDYLQPQADQTLDDALRLADVALYLAKEQGRNRVVIKTPEVR